MRFFCLSMGNMHSEKLKDPAHRFCTVHDFQYFNYKLSIIIAITAAILDILKIWNMGFCCTIIGKFYVENEKDLPNRFWPVHTFLYFSCKLSIISAITAAMLDFSKIWNLGFCYIIIVKFHAKNEKICLIDSGPRIPLRTHTQTDAQTHTRTRSIW